MRMIRIALEHYLSLRRLPLNGQQLMENSTINYSKVFARHGYRNTSTRSSRGVKKVHRLLRIRFDFCKEIGIGARAGLKPIVYWIFLARLRSLRKNAFF